jgi:hypothetical protein
MAQQELRTPAQERYLYADLLAVSCEEILYWWIIKIVYFNFLNCKFIFAEPKSKPGPLSQHSLQSEQQQQF